jgi:hypothetical protein
MNQDNGEKIDAAVGKVADMVAASAHDSQKALHLSQAVLNLSHAKLNLSTAVKPANQK